MDKFLERLSRLLCVKSLVTLVLTAVFAALALKGTISQEFITIYTVVVSFYFGTQHERTGAAIRQDSAAPESGGGGEG